MRNRDTERQRHGDSDDTEETEEVSALAACVKTLQEAVQLSLITGWDEKCLFTFSRALKAFEITTNRRLPKAERHTAFVLWWNTAKPQLPPEADFDEYRLDFEVTFAKTKSALGANSLEEAVRRADSNPPPPQAERYTNLKLKRLVAVCYHLQTLQGDSPFFIGVRDAAKILGTNDLDHANKMLAGLMHEEILRIVEKGTRRRATRFRFILPESATTETISPPAPTPQPHAKFRPSRGVNAPAPRPPTTYELVECKKALLELIKGISPQTDFDYHTPEEAKRFRELNDELRRVNKLLAGVVG